MYYVQTVDMCSECAKSLISKARALVTQHNIPFDWRSSVQGCHARVSLERVTGNGASQERPCSAASMESVGLVKTR